MKVLLLKKKRNIIEELKETTTLDEVANVLRGIRQRTIFLEIINELLNQITELECAYKKELRKNVLRDKEEEIEIL